MADRVAFVTGAGSGLGAAIARRLADDGHLVVANDVDADAAGVTAAAIGGEVATFDVADSAAFDAAVDDVVARHGHLDLMVNNAGILGLRPDVVQRTMEAMLVAAGGEPPPPASVLSTLSDEAWDRMIKTHLYGTFHGTRAALRHMEPARRGSIVNMASIYGHNPSALQPDYAVAKAAIEQLTRSVAQEVAPLGIRVNAVAPGFIDTPLLAPMDDVLREVARQRTPAGRFGRAEEVAEMVAFLASDRASFCFGEVLGVTGASRG